MLAGCAREKRLTSNVQLLEPMSQGAARSSSSPKPAAANSWLVLAGRIFLAAGEFDRNLNSLARAELYDPATGLWTATGAMAAVRWVHTATLPNGQVLVAGNCCLPRLSRERGALSQRPGTMNSRW